MGQFPTIRESVCLPTRDPCTMVDNFFLILYVLENFRCRYRYDTSWLYQVSNLLDDPLATMFGPLTTKLVVDWHCFWIDADPDTTPSFTHVGKSEDKKIFLYFLVSVILWHNFPYFRRYSFWENILALHLVEMDTDLTGSGSTTLLLKWFFRLKFKKNWHR